MKTTKSDKIALRAMSTDATKIDTLLKVNTRQMFTRQSKCPRRDAAYALEKVEVGCRKICIDLLLKELQLAQPLGGEVETQDSLMLHYVRCSKGANQAVHLREEWT